MASGAGAGGAPLLKVLICAWILAIFSSIAKAFSHGDRLTTIGYARGRQIAWPSGCVGHCLALALPVPLKFGGPSQRL